MEKTEVKDTKKNRPLGTLKRYVSYQWIADNIGFFLFLAVLAVVYIANGHRADKMLRDINAASSQIKDLQFEYKTLKSELMFQSRESQIIKAVAPMGIKMSSEPPMKIRLLKK
ncbi:MAG: FtsL-like putative cell division protein [Chitinophagaceae bacterium]